MQPASIMHWNARSLSTSALADNCRSVSLHLLLPFLLFSTPDLQSFLALSLLEKVNVLGQSTQRSADQAAGSAYTRGFPSDGCPAAGLYRGRARRALHLHLASPPAPGPRSPAQQPLAHSPEPPPSPPPPPQQPQMTMTCPCRAPLRPRARRANPLHPPAPTHRPTTSNKLSSQKPLIPNSSFASTKKCRSARLAVWTKPSGARASQTTPSHPTAFSAEGSSQLFIWLTKVARASP